jgi:hypothetical protein
VLVVAGCGGGDGPSEAQDAGRIDAAPAEDGGTRDAGAEGGAGLADAAISDAALPGEDAATDSGAGDAGEAFSRSYVRPSCGPADGPAFELALFDGSVAACSIDGAPLSVSFYVHDLSGAPIPPMGGNVITSTTALPSGTANRCLAGVCESSEDWSLTVRSYDVAMGARGSYTVLWADGSRSAGQFDAAWCAGRPRCP